MAAGYALREAARQIGVAEATLRHKAKREGWYRPAKEAATMPPPPPPRMPHPPTPPSVSGDGGPADTVDPPGPESYADDIAYYRALMRWATEGVARRARHAINIQMWLVEKLPGAIKALSAVENESRNEAENQALISAIEARLAKIQAPAMTAESQGIRLGQDGEAVG